MAKILSVLVVVAVLLGAFIALKQSENSYKALPMKLETTLTQAPFESWREFKDPLGRFSVSLPYVPQHASESRGDVESKNLRKYDMFVAEKEDGTTLMISLISYPGGLETTSSYTLLESVLNEMLNANQNSKLVSQGKSKFLNHDSLDFVISNQDVNIESKTFVDGNTLYILSFVAKGAKFDQKEYEYFIQSFKLLSGPR